MSGTAKKVDDRLLGLIKKKEERLFELEQEERFMQRKRLKNPTAINPLLGRLQTQIKFIEDFIGFLKKEAL